LLLKVRLVLKVGPKAVIKVKVKIKIKEPPILTNHHHLLHLRMQAIIKEMKLWLNILSTLIILIHLPKLIDRWYSNDYNCVINCMQVFNGVTSRERK